MMSVFMMSVLGTCSSWTRKLEPGGKRMTPLEFLICSEFGDVDSLFPEARAKKFEGTESY